MLRGNRDLIKAMNRNLILNILRREGELSRTQITEISGLSVGAVSQIINDLIQNAWIFEIGEGDYTGGRRQMRLRLNPTAGYAIGLKLMENRVVGALTNFASNVLLDFESPINFDGSPDTLTVALGAMIDGMIERSGLARDEFFGVGIGLAGVIYPQQGIVHYSPYFGWRDVPLAHMLQTQIGLPVYVENDVNTLTLSEYLFGAGRHQDNFVVVTIGRGIGMGIVINGQLYQGARGGAGELGHIILDLPKARRSVDAGSLETLASDPAVLRALHNGGGGEPTRNDAPEGGGGEPTLAEVIRVAEAGGDDARAALALSGEYLGVGLATVINILCPRLIIISGEGVAAGSLRLDPMLAAMRRYTFNGLLNDVEVIVEPTDDQAWARGAASVVMSKVFESPLVENKVSR
jgi:predicted NBD/HSP70 family sugar kinase